MLTKTSLLKYDYDNSTDEMIKKIVYEAKMKSSNPVLCPILEWTIGNTNSGAFGRNAANGLV